MPGVSWCDCAGCATSSLADQRGVSGPSWIWSGVNWKSLAVMMPLSSGIMRVWSCCSLGNWLGRKFISSPALREHAAGSRHSARAEQPLLVLSRDSGSAQPAPRAALCHGGSRRLPIPRQLLFESCGVFTARLLRSRARCYLRKPLLPHPPHCRNQLDELASFPPMGVTIPFVLTDCACGSPWRAPGLTAPSAGDPLCLQFACRM